MPRDQKTPVDLNPELSPWTEVVGYLTELSRTRRGVRCTIETTVQVELPHVDETDLEEFLGMKIAILNVGNEYRLRTRRGEVRSVQKDAE